jgi:ATP-binding cassette subfamily C exporter for protease/lipase
MNTSTVRAARSPTPELALAVASLKPWLLRAAGFTMVASLLMLVSSWYMLEVYERVVNSRSHVTLAMLTLMVIGAFVVMEVLEWAHAHEMHEAGLALDARLAPRVFAATFEANLRRLPMGSTQPLADLRTLCDFWGSLVFKGILEAPVALVFLGVIFAIHPLLGTAALAGAALQALVAWLNGRSTQGVLSGAGVAAGAAQQYVFASMANARVIRAMGMLGAIHGRWLQRQREYLRLHAQASQRAAVFGSLSKFLQTVMASLLLGLAGWLFLRNQLAGGAGMMIVASILGGRVLQPLVQVVTQWRTAVAARDALQRLNALLAQVPERPRRMPLPRPQGRLLAENILAAAPGSQVPILKGVSFALNPGEVLAVTGPSAGGKTTLARVLVGVWPSAGGKARLDGADVFAWDKNELGAHVGYLPQDVELFEGSIAENIARFGAIDMAQVEEAARACGLHELVESLPQGYATDVGAGGARLSGGQRQKVGLARAVYGNPVFVVLDEPNSSLDESGEAALADTIARLKARGTTFVVITHRPGVLAVADKLLVLTGGVVQAFGARDDVMKALHEARQKAEVVRARVLHARPGPGGVTLPSPEAAA